MKHIMRQTAGLALIPLFVAATPALANTEVDKPSPDACLKAMKGLGASIGHTKKTGPDGRVTYTFQLRTGGHDYKADCDAATGVVGDVQPYFVPQSG